MHPRQKELAGAAAPTDKAPRPETTGPQPKAIVRHIFLFRLGFGPLSHKAFDGNLKYHIGFHRLWPLFPRIEA
jgi:hypothetical protein